MKNLYSVVELELNKELIFPQINLVFLKVQFDVDYENHMPHCPLFGQNKLFAYIYGLKAKLKGSVAVKFIFELEPSNFYRMIVFIQETFLSISIKIGLIVFFNDFFYGFPR